MTEGAEDFTMSDYQHISFEKTNGSPNVLMSGKYLPSETSGKWTFANSAKPDEKTAPELPLVLKRTLRHGK